MFQIYNYNGFGNCESECGLHVLKGQNGWAGKTIVMFEELESNRGTSITNAIEILADKATYELGLKSSEVIIIDYFKDSGYSLVEFSSPYRNPSWKFLTEEVMKDNCENFGCG